MAGLGPLQPYLDDPTVEEIWINEPGKVFVARDGIAELTTTILTADEVRDLVERMLKSSGRRVDLSSPFVDAMLADGSRLHVVIPDITREHWAVNIRKFVVKADHLDDLVRLGTLTPQAGRASSRRRVASGLNILVAGGTQAGKTTLLNCLAAAIPAARPGRHLRGGLRAEDARCATWSSMQCRQPSLEGTGEIPLRRLVKEALRMRPSRIIVGEVRQAESLDLLIALNSGLPGHVHDPRQQRPRGGRPRCAPCRCSPATTSVESFVVPTVAPSSTSSSTSSLDARRRTSGARDRRACPVGSRATSSRSPTSSSPAADGSRGRTASHRTSERFERAGYDLAAPAGREATVMRGVLVGLLLGAGLFCIWWSFWPARSTGPRHASRPGRAGSSDDIAQAGYASVSPGNVLAAGAASRAVGLRPRAGVLPASCPIALCFGADGRRMRRSPWCGCARAARRADLRDLWPDAVDNITSAVRAGLALPEALASSRSAVPRSCGPPSPRSREDYRTTGRFHDCLDRLKDRLADPVGDRLVESLRIAREVGGSDLGRLLRTLSTFLREDARTRAELETRQGWTVNAARLAVAAPWVVLAMLALQRQLARGLLVTGRLGRPGRRRRPLRSSPTAS